VKNILILLVLSLTAVTAPLSVYFAVSAYAGFRNASIQHTLLQQQQKDLHEYSQQVAEYKQFAARVTRFIDNAKVAGVAEDGWNRHHVDIKQRVVTYAEMDQFIADAGSGENYYFLPAKLRIEVPDLANNRLHQAGKKPSNNAVKVSLTGDFLVRVK